MPQLAWRLEEQLAQNEEVSLQPITLAIWERTILAYELSREIVFEFQDFLNSLELDFIDEQAAFCGSGGDDTCTASSTCVVDDSVLRVADVVAPVESGTMLRTWKPTTLSEVSSGPPTDGRQSTCSTRVNEKRDCSSPLQPPADRLWFPSRGHTVKITAPSQLLLRHRQRRRNRRGTHVEGCALENLASAQNKAHLPVYPHKSATILCLPSLLVIYSDSLLRLIERIGVLAGMDGRCQEECCGTV